jgi:hypothetical protein
MSLQNRSNAILPLSGTKIHVIEEAKKFFTHQFKTKMSFNLDSYLFSSCYIGRAPAGRAMRYSRWSVSHSSGCGSLIKAAQFTWLFWLCQHSFMHHALRRVPTIPHAHTHQKNNTKNTPPTKK